MAQNFYSLDVTKDVKTVIPQMQTSLESVASNFSGEVFPTANLFVGMKCYRTDLKNTYKWDGTDWLLDSPSFATDDEAKAGTVDDKIMSPARVKTAISNVKGVSNGLATLDNTGKIPTAQIPQLSYVPTTSKGADNGIASLDADKILVEKAKYDAAGNVITDTYATKDGLTKAIDGMAVFSGATDTTASNKGLVPVAAAGDQKKFFRGDGTWSTAESGLTKVVYTTPGTYTWTCPAGITMILVTVIGAGGGGAGGAYLNNTTVCPNGGGGGNIIRDFSIPVTPGTDYAITVGAGGNGGAATKNGAPGINLGSNGGASSFGSILYASGGMADGTGALIYGYSGNSQIILNSGQSQTTGSVGGRGGGLFGGSAGNNSTPPGNGGLGSGGGGAAGKYDNNTPSVKTGGNGGPGMVLLMY